MLIARTGYATTSTIVAVLLKIRTILAIAQGAAIGWSIPNVAVTRALAANRFDGSGVVTPNPPFTADFAWDRVHSSTAAAGEFV
jgi:hypothetical protein